MKWPEINQYFLKRRNEAQLLSGCLKEEDEKRPPFFLYLLRINTVDVNRLKVISPFLFRLRRNNTLEQVSKGRDRP